MPDTPWHRPGPFFSSPRCQTSSPARSAAGRYASSPNTCRPSKRAFAAWPHHSTAQGAGAAQVIAQQGHSPCAPGLTHLLPPAVLSAGAWIKEPRCGAPKLNTPAARRTKYRHTSQLPAPTTTHTACRTESPGAWCQGTMNAPRVRRTTRRLRLVRRGTSAPASCCCCCRSPAAAWWPGSARQNQVAHLVDPLHNSARNCSTGSRALRWRQVDLAWGPLTAVVWEACGQHCWGTQLGLQAWGC